MICPLLLPIFVAALFAASASCFGRVDAFLVSDAPRHYHTNVESHGPSACVRASKRNSHEEEDVFPHSMKTLLTKTAGTATALGLVLATTTTAALALEGDITRGATLFANNCASCHIGGTNVIKPAKTLQLKDLEKNIKSADQENVQKFFQNSMQHKMLNFPKVEGGKLSEQQVVDVTGYVSDQALGNKW